MKKLLLLCFLFLGFFTNQTNAQLCTPDKTLVDSVVGLSVLFPAPYDSVTMTGGFEDTTCIDVYFETVLNFVIPETVPFNGNDVPVFNVKITGVADLPEGINYACNPESCVFTPADSVACVVLYGIATDANAPGDYKLGIEGTANVGLEVPLELLINDDAGGYFLYVRDQSQVSCVGVSTENPLTQSMSLSAIPNPFAYSTELQIGSDISGEFRFQVFNTLGAVQYSEKINIIEGINRHNFDASFLAEGVYFYTISNEMGQLSGKMMINR